MTGAYNTWSPWSPYYRCFLLSLRHDKQVSPDQVFASTSTSTGAILILVLVLVLALAQVPVLVFPTRSVPDLRISPPRVPMDGFKPFANFLSPPWLPKSSEGLKLTVSDGSRIIQFTKLMILHRATGTTRSINQQQPPSLATTASSPKRQEGLSLEEFRRRRSRTLLPVGWREMASPSPLRHPRGRRANPQRKLTHLSSNLPS